MFRKLCHIALLVCYLSSVGCHSQPPTIPTIAKGDYGAIIHYLQDRIPAQMAHHNVQGLSIALVNGQELIWARGFGYADKSRFIPVSANTAFRAGDISKLITAAAALQLVEQNKLRLDAPIIDTLGEFQVRSRFHKNQGAANRDITLRRLLSHQSGLPAEHLRGLRSDFTMGQMPMRVSGVWLAAQPGTQIVYSNLGYTLVGAAIERSAGVEFEPFLQRTLLNPLEMGRSSFVGSSAAIGYAQGFENGKAIAASNIRDLAADGLWTTPRDLSHYVQMLFTEGLFKGKRVMSATSVREMLKQQNDGNVLDFDCKVGLGWFLTPCGRGPVARGVRTYQQSGAGDGFTAQMAILPDHQLAVVIMTNDGAAEKTIAHLAARTLGMLLQAQTGDMDSATDYPQATSSERKIPTSSDRKRLAGVYATTWGILRLRDEHHHLYGEMSNSRFELLHDDQNWLRAQHKILNVWGEDLGEIGRVRLDVVSAQGREVLIAKSHGQWVAVGEKFEPTPLIGNWTNMVGTYQVLTDHEPSPPASSICVRLEEGFLVIHGQLHDRALADYILQPVDNAHAVLVGSSYGLGDTVTRQVNGLSVSGYYFKRIHTPAALLRDYARSLIPIILLDGSRHISE